MLELYLWNLCALLVVDASASYYVIVRQLLGVEM